VIFVGVALLVIGVVVLFFAPWVGIPAGLVGLALVVAALLGVGRRAASPPSA
jgi:hypothetical protein